MIKLRLGKEKERNEERRGNGEEESREGWVRGEERRRSEETRWEEGRRREDRRRGEERRRRDAKIGRWLREKSIKDDRGTAKIRQDSSILWKLSKWTKTNILIINKRKRLLPLAKIIIVGKEFRSWCTKNIISC